MKKIILPACLAIFLAAGTGCGSNGSSDTSSTDSSSSMMSGDTGTQAADTGSAMSMSNAPTRDTSMEADKAFAMEAASGGMMEVELGKYAAAHGTSAKVKQFGAMMVTDHTKANTELKTIAKSKGVMLPTAPAEKQQKHIDDMKAKKGADFDKEYVDMMVDDHKEDISKFEEESKNGNDPEVKAFATKTLPTLNKHLQAIQAIQDGMKQ